MNVSRGIKYFYWYICGNYIVRRHYQFHLFNGKCFQGKWNGIGAIGWKWVVMNWKDSKKKLENVVSPYPINSNQKVLCPENIQFHQDDWGIFQVSGCYFQALGKITIGKGCYIAPNVGIITANHRISNIDEHDPPQSVALGKKCWIGMNAVILPGVVLGDNTIVGAGSVVTKSFPDGNMVIAGNPAKMIKKINLKEQ